MDTKTTPKPDDKSIADEVWARYRYVVDRGHRDYTKQARLCERMYMGGGRQWEPEEAAALLAQRRKPREFNEILPSINSALGHQIKNRLSIALRPRGGAADQAQAELRTKVLMQIADQAHLHWKETEVFGDGLIEQRGYFDVRMSFADNMQGNLQIEVLDPLDVIPDPDAKTYEPSGWEDVIRTRWLTMTEIAEAYGQKKADELAAKRVDDSDHGDEDDAGEERNKFAFRSSRGALYDAGYSENGIRRARVIERQRWHNVMSRMMFYPRTGDRVLAENLTPEVIAQQTAAGAVMTKAMHKRVKWTCAAGDVLLHDAWSPYDTFTVIPYFAFFRRGQTLGLVDNAIDPQRARNKALSNFEHILGTTANSGWVTEENSITNMTPAEFAAKGAMTGLNIEVRKGSQYPQKIQPSQVPQGYDRYIGQVTDALKSVTVPDAARGQDGPETSGIARQTQQFAAQQQIAVPLDNLARTRHLLAEKILQLVRQYYTESRTFRITETDFQTGKSVDSMIEVNKFDPVSGAFVNDLTEGDYDVVISEQPISATFEDSQFQQAMDMRKAGVAIPDAVVVQSSSLARKAEVVEQMQNAQAPADPLGEAKAALLAAQTRKTDAQAVQDAVTGMFSATQAANQIAAVPAVAPLADALLKSAGFVDRDESPIVPSAPDGIAAMPMDVQANTSPSFPAVPQSPAKGAAAGIERMDQQQGVPQ